MDYTQLIEQYQEINPANYGPDDVDALNAWGIEAFAALEALQARVTELEKANEVLTILNKCKPLPLDVADIEAERDAAQAKLRELESARPVPAAPTVPEGWKLVPLKLTEAMEDAVEKAELRHVLADRKLTGGKDPQLSFKAAYEAMLAAAPTGEQG